MCANPCTSVPTEYVRFRSHLNKHRQIIFTPVLFTTYGGNCQVCTCVTSSSATLTPTTRVAGSSSTSNGTRRAALATWWLRQRQWQRRMLLPAAAITARCRRRRTASHRIWGKRKSRRYLLCWLLLLSFEASYIYIGFELQSRPSEGSHSHFDLHSLLT